LRDIICRKTSPNRLQTHLQMNEDINNHMLFFLENHDEQRIASIFFAGFAQAAIPALIFTTTCQPNPIMIYNGQELGEKGMDNEGFSGLDGKTSIFDYGRMDSIYRWANNGAFDGGLLSKEQLSLHATYKKILTLAKDEKSFSTGSFYGLDYCNYDNPYFPSDHMTAYLRKYENELILVCINFDNRAHNFRLRVPEPAFTVFHLPDNTVSIMKNLLSEEEEESICSLTYTCQFQGIAPALSAKILKFKY